MPIDINKKAIYKSENTLIIHGLVGSKVKTLGSRAFNTNHPTIHPPKIDLNYDILSFLTQKTLRQDWYHDP